MRGIVRQEGTVLDRITFPLLQVVLPLLPKRNRLTYHELSVLESQCMMVATTKIYASRLLFYMVVNMNSAGDRMTVGGGHQDQSMDHPIGPGS